MYFFQTEESLTSLSWIPKNNGRSRRTLYCGNNDCKPEFNSFDKYRDHVLYCTVKEIYPASICEPCNSVFFSSVDAEGD